MEELLCDFSLSASAVFCVQYDRSPTSVTILGHQWREVCLRRPRNGKCSFGGEEGTIGGIGSETLSLSRNREAYSADCPERIIGGRCSRAMSEYKFRIDSKRKYLHFIRNFLLKAEIKQRTKISSRTKSKSTMLAPKTPHHSNVDSPDGLLNSGRRCRTESGGHRWQRCDIE